MSHSKLYAKGKISLREFRQLQLLKARAHNKAFTKTSRKEANRMYKERERAYKKRK